MLCMLNWKKEISQNDYEQITMGGYVGNEFEIETKIQKHNIRNTKRTVCEESLHSKFTHILATTN